ncbi:ribokinase [Macrococcoides caseolyticum]|uniref:ribokinase n=1 Tax=Macrococcoides caseolyticum TaxID=69966 RepID=UPI001F3251C6|nr:ribokinase [Macrococcus caseolyticus]MCE4956002.1 ribokinase [Macrococcus caseolyticus]
MRDIYVIGSMSVDLVTQASRLPKKGETILGESFFMTNGGKGANQAVSAARLGARVHMVGCVGDDSFGEMILNNLKENHVFVDNVEPITHCASGTAHITLADNDNSIIVVPSANGKVTTEHVDKVIDEMPEQSIILLQNEIPKVVIEHVIEKAYEKGITTIYNPAPFIEMDKAILSKVSYFTPNETEVKDMFGEGYERVIAEYPKQMIVTLGDQGATYFDDQLINIPSIKAEVVDTTGAGDTFNGAFAVALSEGRSLSDALHFANRAASISVGGLGAQGGMPYRKDME